jgi:SAM-dependent methyltransferase
LERTQDSDIFLQEIEKYIGPNVGQFNYEDMVRGFPDKSHFYDLVELLLQFRSPVGATILSSGCGFAGSVFVWAEAGASHVWGIEVDREMARIGGVRMKEWPNAHVLVYDGDLLPFPDDVFDIIDSIHVVEHVRNLQIYVGELVRVLKPGGICYISCPNRLYYLETHAMLPFVHWLPKALGDRLGKVIAMLPFWSRSIRDRLRVLDTMTLRYVTSWTLQRQFSKRGAQVRYLDPYNPVLQWLARCGVPGSVLPTMEIRLLFSKQTDRVYQRV